MIGDFKIWCYQYESFNSIAKFEKGSKKEQKWETLTLNFKAQRDVGIYILLKYNSSLF